MTQQLLELAERCEAATGPDREIDAQIIVTLEHPEYRYPDEVLNRKPSSWDEAAGRFRHDGFGGSIPWPAYTASIDAALTLVPSGHLWQVNQWETGADAHMAPTRPIYSPQPKAKAATPALAICAAALRARAAQ